MPHKINTIRVKLGEKVPDRYMKTRKGAGDKTFHYIDGDYIYYMLNELFGVENTDKEIKHLELDNTRVYTKDVVRNGPYNAEKRAYDPAIRVHESLIEFTFRAIVRLTVKVVDDEGNVITFFREGAGTGLGTASNEPGASHHQARQTAQKAAETDASKRAAKQLGSALGLAIGKDGTQQYASIPDDEENSFDTTASGDAGALPAPARTTQDNHPSQPVVPAQRAPAANAGQASPQTAARQPNNPDANGAPANQQQPPNQTRVVAATANNHPRQVPASSSYPDRQSVNGAAPASNTAPAQAAQRLPAAAPTQSRPQNTPANVAPARPTLVANQPGQATTPETSARSPENTTQTQTANQAPAANTARGPAQTAQPANAAPPDEATEQKAKEVLVDTQLASINTDLTTLAKLNKTEWAQQFRDLHKLVVSTTRPDHFERECEITGIYLNTVKTTNSIPDPLFFAEQLRNQMATYLEEHRTRKNFKIDVKSAIARGEETNQNGFTPPF